VRGAVAAAIGLEVGPGLTTQGLVAALRGRRMLLVLDNCAHLIDAVAELVSAILRGAPGVRILATSREPLRCEGEHLCRLEPLEVPPAGRIDAAEALRYPAVRLFAWHAEATLDGFELADEDAPVAAEICRKLDGIPLAIELAAAWVGVLGLRGLAAQLDDRLRLLTGGRRTSVPQHRTMRAALDWSHDLLSAPERMVLRRLAVFSGGFTLAMAACVAADGDTPADDVARIVLELTSKSLVVPDLDTPGPRFHLLQTTRAYALEKAREADELPMLGRRHASCVLDLLETAAHGEHQHGGGADTRGEREIDNLRTALAWAFSPGGDAALGVDLAAAALPLWFSAALMSEAHAWAERGIEALERAGLRGSRQEMLLRTAHGISQQMVRAGTSEAREDLSRALALAEQLQDTDHRLHLLHTLWTHHMRLGEVGTALDLAGRAEALAEAMADPDAGATATWMLGIAQHFAGEHGAAQARLEQFLSAPEPSSPGLGIRRAGFDPTCTARYVLGHVLWVRGHAEQAVDAVKRATEDARRHGHPVTLCSVLAFGDCALALRLGDLEAASRSAAEVVRLAEAHALGDHLSYGRAAEEVIALRKAGPKAGHAQLRAAIERWRSAQWHVVLTAADLAGAAIEAEPSGMIGAIVDDAIDRAERDRDLWAWPELLRLKGEILLRQHTPDAREARHCFERSLERANGQGALAWQLRTAASLHRLSLADGGARRSRELLSRTLKAFREDMDTADLRAARRLLAGEAERHGSR
jgi:predicted ATPase